MENILKLQSREGGPFTISQNRVTLSIPAGKVYNLAKSYVSIMGRINAVSPDASVYSAQIRYTQPDGTETNLAPSSACMIKNSRMTSAKFGIMEDIKRTDLWFCNMNVLEESNNDLQGHFYEAPVQSFTRANTKGSVFRELHREGTVASRDLVAPFKIPLSQMFALGKHTISTDALGRIDLHLELQMDRFKAEQLLKSTDNFGNAENKAFADIGGIGVYNTLTTKKVFERLEDSPYFVSQSISIAVETVTGAVNPPTFALITGIEWIRDGADAGKIKLTFSAPIANFTQASDAWADVTVEGRDASSLDFTADFAELTLQESDDKVDMSRGLTFSTISTEEDNANGNKNFRKTYFLEPNAYNLWCVLPDADNDLQSNLANITDWRLRLDGIDLTNRNIVKDSPLDNDRTAMSMLNSGKMLRSLVNCIPKDNTQNKDQYTLANTKMISNPLPLTPQRKILDVAINCGNGTTGVNRFVLFKEITKTIGV